MEQVKLLSMTTVLTLLIWVTADNLLTETARIGIALHVMPANGEPSRLVDVDSSVVAIELEVRGPRRAIESVRSQLPRDCRFRLPEMPDHAFGPTSIPLDLENLKGQLVDQIDDLDKLSVISVSPDSLDVTVDRLVQRQTVLSMRALTLRYESPPQLSRTSVTTTVRESILSERESEGRPIELDISAEIDRQFRNVPAGVSQTLPITLTPQALGSDARVVPDSVKVTAAVMTDRIVEEVSTVPILVAVSFANLERSYRPVTSDGTPLELLAPQITVTGPAEEVLRLVRGDTRAYGIVRLKEADLQNLDELKYLTPEYILPDRVELAEPPAGIEFRLIDVKKTAPGN